MAQSIIAKILTGLPPIKKVRNRHRIFAGGPAVGVVCGVWCPSSGRRKNVPAGMGKTQSKDKIPKILAQNSCAKLARKILKKNSLGKPVRPEIFLARIG